MLVIDISFVNFSFCRWDIIESILCESLFPSDFSINDIVKHWVGIFSRFDKVEAKALEKILEQKQRYIFFTTEWLIFRLVSQIFTFHGATWYQITGRNAEVFSSEAD